MFSPELVTVSLKTKNNSNKNTLWRPPTPSPSASSHKSGLPEFHSSSTRGLARALAAVPGPPPRPPVCACPIPCLSLRLGRRAGAPVSRRAGRGRACWRARDSGAGPAPPTCAPCPGGHGPLREGGVPGGGSRHPARRCPMPARRLPSPTLIRGHATAFLSRATGRPVPLGAWKKIRWRAFRMYSAARSGGALGPSVLESTLVPG